MKKYVLIFAIMYLLLMAALSMARVFLKLEGGTVQNVVMICLSSMIVASLFVRDQKRSPTEDETKSFSLLALLSVWVISIPVMIGLIAFQSGFSPDEVGATLDALASMSFLVIFILTSVLYYIVIRLAFSLYIKKMLLPYKSGSL
jgi:hypothetical protein